MNRYKVLLISAVALFSACSTSTEKEVSNEITPINWQDIELTTISKRLITEIVECTGTVDVPPNERAALYAPIGGNVSDIRVLPGDLVKKGQILYRLGHQDIIKKQEEYLLALNDEKLHRINLERKTKLFESKNISERELREVASEYEITRANLESLAAQLKVIGVSINSLVKDGIKSFINVRAPISGYISKIDVVAGSYVNMNNQIMTIVNTIHKHLELQVYADQISNVRKGQLVGFRLVGDETEYWGDVYLVGKEVDSETRTVAVHAHMKDESNNVVIGSYLYAGILTSKDSLFSLPSTSIVTANDEHYVIVKSQDEVTPVKVETGNSFKNYVAIINYNELVGKQIIAEDAYYYFEHE